jgi:hypothetical protein
MALMWALTPAAPAGGGEVLFVAGPSRGGPGRHEHFAAASLLASLSARIPGLKPVVVRDAWPSDQALARARALVLFCDAGADHLLRDEVRVAAVQRLVDARKGLVVVHSALQAPDSVNERLERWVGARFDPGSSNSGRPGWMAGFHQFPDHPVSRGLVPFSLEEQWYFGLRFAPGGAGIVPLLADVPPPHLLNGQPPRSAVLAWTYERPAGGRSFVVTGPHDHDSWGVEELRRLVTNGIVWVSGLEVPARGTAVAIRADELRRNLANPALVFQGEERGPPPPRPRAPAAQPVASSDLAPAAVPARPLPGSNAAPPARSSVVFRRDLPAHR